MSTEAIDRLWRRMQLVVALGRVTTGSDGDVVQQLQVTLGQSEVRDNSPRIGEYGFASMPLAGCHAVMVFVGGDRSNGVIVGTNDQQHRMRNLLPGEVAIHDDQGQSVYIKRGGIVINGGGKPVEIINTPMVTADTPLLRVTGDVQDNCATNPVTLAQMRATYNVHTHNENDVTGEPTDPPNQEML